jgi:GPH family glycoside/pentoside/hexuronide:cation symporter
MQDSGGGSMANVAVGALESDEGTASASFKLSIGFKSRYGFGQFVDGISTTALTYFAFFYLSAVCGLSGTLAGMSAFIALTVDSIADPAIGLLSDSTRAKLGRRHPYMLASIVPIAIAFGLFFMMPRTLTGFPLFAYVTALSIVLRVSVSVFNLPYIAMGAELTDDYRERSTIVAYRVLFGTVANFVCFGLALGVFMKGQNGLLDRAAYIPFGWTCAAVILAGGLIAALGTRSAIGRLHSAVARQGSIVGQFIRELSEIFRSRSFMMLFIGALIFFIAQGAAAALTIHANKYFWHLSAGAVQGVILGLALGPLVGIPLTAVMLRFVDKRTVAVGGLLIFCVSQFTLPFLRIYGVLPADGALLTSVLVVNAVILGAALAAGVIGFQSMMADAADEHEYVFGTRREALFYAGLTLAAKTAGGLGSLIAGVAMDAIDFPSNLAAKGSVLHLAPAVLRDLGIISGPLPAFITAFGALMLFGYRLDQKKHDAIRAALKSNAKS